MAFSFSFSLSRIKAKARGTTNLLVQSQQLTGSLTDLGQHELDPVNLFVGVGVRYFAATTKNVCAGVSNSLLSARVFSIGL